MKLISRIFFWFSKDPMQRGLYVLVPLAHIIFFISFMNGAPAPKPSQKKIVVKTFTAAAPAKVKTQTTSSPPKKQQAPSPPVPKKGPPQVQKKVEPTPQKKPTPPVLKKAPAPKKEKVIQVKREKPYREDLLKELEERIAKIDIKNDRMTPKSELNVPSTLALSSQALQAPKNFEMTQTSFSSEDFASSLIGYLQAYLHLPEVGEVQIQISLSKEGKVKNLKVVKSESEKNRKYLEQELPQLSFPQVYLDSASSDSFLITFCNKF